MPRRGIPIGLGAAAPRHSPSTPETRRGCAWTSRRTFLERARSRPRRDGGQPPSSRRGRSGARAFLSRCLRARAAPGAAAAQRKQGRARRSTPTSVSPAEVILIRVGTLPRSSSTDSTDSPLVSIALRSGSSNALGPQRGGDLHVDVLFGRAVLDLPAVGLPLARRRDRRRPADDPRWRGGGELTECHREHDRGRGPPGTTARWPASRGRRLDTCREDAALGAHARERGTVDGKARQLSAPAGARRADRVRERGEQMASIEQQTAAEAANEEAIRAWDGPLFDRFLRFQHLIEGGFAEHGEAAIDAARAAARRARAGHRLRLRRHDRAARRSGRARRRRPSASTRRRASSSTRARRRQPRRRQRRVPRGRRRPVDGAGRALRPRLLALRHDVLRQPGRGDAQRPRVPCPRRTARDGRSGGGARTTTGSTAPRRSSSRSSAGPRSTTSRPAGRGRSRWPAPTRPATYAARRLRGRRAAALRHADADRHATSSEAIDIVTALGPAGEILRLSGDRAAHLHDQVDEALREGMADMVRPDGVYAMASTWIVTARAPES